MQSRTPWRIATLTLSMLVGLGLAACGNGGGYPAPRVQQVEEQDSGAYPGTDGSSDVATDSGSMTSDSVQSLGVQVHQGQAQAPRAQVLGQGPAYAVGGPGDQSHLSRF